MADNPSLPPRRGGQPGNTNALKHGRYARKYHPASTPGLAEHQFRELQEEALVLRLFISRVVELYDDLEDPGQSLSFLRALSSAMLSLARILRTSNYLAATTETDRLLEAIDQLSRDLSSTLPAPPPSSRPADAA